VKLRRLIDVAGMMSSHHYTDYNIVQQDQFNSQRMESHLLEWAELWYHHISRFYLQGYFDQVKNAPFIPKDKDDLKILMDTYILEKAVYELNYELNNRPDWVLIPIRGIESILNRYTHD